MNITNSHLYAVLALLLTMLAVSEDPRERADGTLKEIAK